MVNLQHNQLKLGNSESLPENMENQVELLSTKLKELQQKNEELWKNWNKKYKFSRKAGRGEKAKYGQIMFEKFSFAKVRKSICYLSNWSCIPNVLLWL